MVVTGKSLSEALLFAQHVLPRFELGIFMYWTTSSMNNLSSYYGLVDAKIRASDKDLAVPGDNPRHSTKDHWIQESIIHISN